MKCVSASYLNRHCKARPYKWPQPYDLYFDFSAFQYYQLQSINRKSPHLRVIAPYHMVCDNSCSTIYCVETCSGVYIDQIYEASTNVLLTTHGVLMCHIWLLSFLLVTAGSLSLRVIDSHQFMQLMFISIHLVYPCVIIGHTTLKTCD